VAVKRESQRRVRLSALTLWRDLPRLDLVSQYYKSGWKVGPAHRPLFQDDKVYCSCRGGRQCGDIGKHPKFSKGEWARRFEGKLDKLLDYFDPHQDDNVGAWLPDELMVVDFDDSHALIEIFGDAPPETLTCATARGSHLYFKAQKDFSTSSFKFKANVDVRAPGSWIMLPPSIHKTQVHYEWDCLVRPTSVPASLIELLYQITSQQAAGAKKTHEYL
jgi:hypothetical protein